MKTEFDRGVFVAKAPDDFGQHAVQRRTHEADREAALDVAHTPRHGFEFGGLRQQLHRMRIEELACLRQFQRPRIALE
jgi:hypothetical protein